MTEATVRTSGSGRGTSRAQATRAALLDAARDVFIKSGFADANIADVVAAAGASVGSLYHHFGGKADLYLALYEDHQARQEERATAAVRQARLAGESDPVRLFVAGARAFFHGCWEERDLARLFLAGGGPPGFELVARRRYREWVSGNAVLLKPRERPLGAALVLVLTTVAAQAGHEIAMQESQEAAYELAEALLELIYRIGVPD